jgi:1-carboxybiuret hydrolase subunit AtzG-like
MNSNDDLDGFIEAGARLLGIPLCPEWREAIRLHLAISLDHARAVAEFALPDEADPAPVFRA